MDYSIRHTNQPYLFPIFRAQSPITRPIPLHPRSIRHNVHTPSMNNPSIRRFFHRLIIERLLQSQSSSRPTRTKCSFWPSNPQRLRLRPPACKRGCRNGRSSNRFSLRHENLIRRDPFRRYHSQYDYERSRFAYYGYVYSSCLRTRSA